MATRSLLSNKVRIWPGIFAMIHKSHFLHGSKTVLVMAIWCCRWPLLVFYSCGFGTIYHQFMLWYCTLWEHMSSTRISDRESTSFECTCFFISPCIWCAPSKKSPYIKGRRCIPTCEQFGCFWRSLTTCFSIGELSFISRRNYLDMDTQFNSLLSLYRC